MKIYLNFDTEYASQFLELLGISRTRKSVATKHLLAEFAWVPESSFCCCNRRIPLIIISDHLRARLPPTLPYKDKHVLILKEKKVEGDR
eukprot:UN20462